MLLATTLVVGFGWGVLTERSHDRGHAYMKAEEAITSQYVNPVDRDKLMRGCYEGMVDSLGDVYSRYYTTDELTKKRDEQKSANIDDILQVQQVDRDGRTFALIWLGTFTPLVEDEFPKRAAAVLDMNPDAVILDLRGNLGGLVSAASAVSGVWIGDKVMARLDNHRGTVELKHGTGDPILGHLPVAVLVNHNTA